MTPAWHDVPPVPGCYQVRTKAGDIIATYVCDETVAYYSNVDGQKFYGPLPDPPPLPEPPKPPRTFRCKPKDGKHRVGVVIDWVVRIFTDSGLQTPHSHGHTMAILSEYTDIEWYDGAPPC